MNCTDSLKLFVCCTVRHEVDNFTLRSTSNLPSKFAALLPADAEQSQKGSHVHAI